jgi:hypothetical protein
MGHEMLRCAQHDRAAPVLSRLRAVAEALSAAKGKGLARRAGSPDGQSSSPNPGSFAARLMPITADLLALYPS